MLSSGLPRTQPLVYFRQAVLVPTLTSPYAVLKNAPQPNLTKLFLAWMVTDGVSITEPMEWVSRVTLPRLRDAWPGGNRLVGPDFEFLRLRMPEQDRAARR